MNVIKSFRLVSAGILISSMVTSLCVAASTSVEALLETAIPAAATTAVVALNTLHNGRVVSISTFETTQPVEQTLAFYRSLWPASVDGPGTLESTVGEWQIISHIDNEYLVALQLKNRADGATSGYLSITQLVPGGSIEAVSLALPPGGELLSTTSHIDTSPQAVTSVVRSNAGVGLVSAFYRDTLEREGWKLVSARTNIYPHVLLMNGPGGSLNIIVSEAQDGSSVAVVNRVNNHD
ncbi:MAG: hypothetical protein V3U76_13595 [Granulosicoccus sp.]